MTKKNLTIGLLWHSPNSDNLGVGALTVAHIAILESLARQMDLSLRFKIMGWRDPEPAYVVGDNIQIVAIRARHLIDPRNLFAEMRDCDAILDISAGDSFSDIYGTQRFIYGALSRINAFLARRPFLLSPQTIGPFDRWWARRLAVIMMGRARKVVTRDTLSSDYLKSLGLERKLVESTDVAFRLPYERSDERAVGPVRVGINISGLLFNGGYSRKNMFALKTDYAAFARAICRHFTSLPDCELNLIGHVNSRLHEVEDDFRVAEKLAAEFPGAVVAPRFANPSSAKSYIAGMDFFVGSRMHACIAAFSSGVPVLPVAYSRKFAGLFGSLGYDHLADCRIQSDSEVLDAVLEAFQRRDELKSDVAQALKQVDKKLAAYEGVLKGVFEEASGN